MGKFPTEMHAWRHLAIWLVDITRYTLPIRHVTSSSAIGLLSACTICWFLMQRSSFSWRVLLPFGCCILKIGCVELAHATVQELERFSDEGSRRKVFSAFRLFCVWQHALFSLGFVWLKPQVPYSSCLCAQCLDSHNRAPSKEHWSRLSECWQPQTEVQKSLILRNAGRLCIGTLTIRVRALPPSQELLPVSIREAG